MANIWLEEHNAIDEDLATLFSEFDKTGSVRFDDFSKIWRSLKLSLIHSGRRRWHEKRRATERLLRVLSKYLTEATSFQFRIAAVYALYAAYHTQLCEVKVKIRLTPTMWKELNALRALVKEQQHYDAEYIINSMIDDKAFMFCAMPFPLEYLQNEFMLKKESAIDTTHLFGYEPDEYVQDLVENLDAIKTISKVEKDYLKAKERILENIVDGKKTPARKRLCSIEENLHGRILDYTEDFHHWLVTKTAFGKYKAELLENLETPSAMFEPLKEKAPEQTRCEISKEDSASSRSSQKEASRRSEKLQALKTKAFKRKSQNIRWNTEEENESVAETVESNDAINDEPPEAPLRRTFYRRSAVRELYGIRGRRTKRKGGENSRK